MGADATGRSDGLAGGQRPAGLRRAYLTARRCGTGQVHVRLAGSGPAVMVVPDSPGTGASLAWLAEDLAAAGHAVLVPDLLGAGSTTCRPDGGLARQSLLLRDVLDAVGWPAVTVLAEGAGAAVALRLAADRPGLVTGVGVLAAPYAGPVAGPPWDGEPRLHGEHLLTLWHELRDATTFSPWWEHRSAARRRRGQPSPGTLHEVFIDALPHAPAHRALADAARREWAGLLAAVDVPVAAAADLADGDAAARLLAELPAAAPAPAAVSPGAVSGGAVCGSTVSRGATAGQDGAVALGYADCDFGQLHVRIARPAQSAQVVEPPVLLLHANPGSSAGLEPLLAALGTSRLAVAVDLPGHGRSDPLPWRLRPAAALAGTYAPLLLRVLDELELDRVDVYGGHTGAGLAAELAILAPGRVRSLVLDGVPLFDDDPGLVEAVLASYFLDLTPDEHGGHLVRAWNMTWDMALWWPWFSHGTGAIRAVDAYPAAFIHRITADMLRSLPTYAVSYRAAWQWAATSRLPLVRQPALVGSSRTDPLRAMTPRALALLPDAREARFPSLSSSAGPAELAARIREFTESLRC